MKPVVTIDPRLHDAVIFDLDGVVTDTAAIHAAAWKTAFDEFLSRRPRVEGENHTPFTDADYRDFVDGKPRLDGARDFLNSRGVTLPTGSSDERPAETLEGLVSRKQQVFLERLGAGVPVFRSTVALVRRLAEAGVATAVYSASRNCEHVLRVAGLEALFTVRVDGNVAADLGLRGKPDPDMLVETVGRLGALPERSVVVEDAQAGVEAGRSGGFALVIGVDRTGHADELVLHGADVVVSDLAEVAVRTGYRRMSLLPNALESFVQLTGVVRDRMPFVCLDIDGPLSEIVAEPAAARPGRAAAVLERLAAHCPVVILSGLDAAEVRDRVRVPGVWYAGSHGFELIAPDGSRHHNTDADAAASDKGTALAWIGQRIQQTGRVLPIYIGDDPTDEAAFDAVRFTGVGVAVRHETDSNRPTAARFTLSGTAEVLEFLRRGGDWLTSESQTSAEAWTFTFDDYDPPNERLRESLCTVGNGYFAIRGSAPESTVGRLHYPGTYAAGVYNRLEDVVAGVSAEHESLVNLPNWLPLTFRIDGGDWFDVDSVELLSYRQTFDIRSAVLTRDLRFRDEAGRITTVRQSRFAAMHLAHVAALETTILAEDWSGTVRIRSTIDGDVNNSLVERYRDLASNHLRGLTKAALSENSVLLAVETNQSEIPIALAARTTVWRDHAPAFATYRLVDEEFAIGHEISAQLAAGESLTAEKVVTLVTGRDVATSNPVVGAERILVGLERFGEIRDGHVLAWAQLWERLSIDFTDHVDELRVLRLHLAHLLQTVSHNSEDLDVGVPARGLNGEAYRGHIFWDELFIFSVLNLRIPAITRSLLRYRHRRLEEACRAARLAGYRGAMFPWQSGSDGREESPAMHLNPRSGRWNPDPSNLAHHIGIAVAYNVWQYYQVTGDLAYLIDYGAETLLEIARFWCSRTTYDGENDRYHIRGVIGPDEFHSGYPDRPYDGIDNNAYTNIMAVWVMLRAIDALESMPLSNRFDLCEKLRITDAELALWDHVSRRMFVPFHDSVISQFEGYEQLAELDWDAYRMRYGNIQRLDRILESENDDVNRYRASKQADVLMLLYLLSSDELRELLDRLGYSFEPQQIPKMVDYYISRTSHGSTLSGVVHAWVLARANRDHAMAFFRQVLDSDIADSQGGTTSEGIHLAALAGSVDLVQRCFTGLETRCDRLILSPNCPESLGTLEVPLRYRGAVIRLRVSGRSAEVSADLRDAPPVVVECRGRVEQLASGQTVRFTA